MIWVVLCLAFMFAAPFAIEMTRKTMDDAARETAPGQFAPLSQGITHFQWYGPDSGPLVVCIHGLTTPSFVWRSTAKGLAARGYRVLTYDLYGRGYSDRPSGIQDQAFFLQQLNDLLEDQRVAEPMTVIGYSMGGVVATAFSSHYPDKVRELVLLAPAGMKTQGFGALRQICLMPVVGLWLMLAAYPRILRRGIAAEAGLKTTVEGINALQLTELDWRGFVPAVRASIQGILTNDFEAAHRQIHNAEIPVLAIWGREDDVIPIKAADLLETWNPATKTHIIDDAGHGLTYTHTDDVLADFDQFITARA